MTNFSIKYDEKKISLAKEDLKSEVNSFKDLKTSLFNEKNRPASFKLHLEDITFDATRHQISSGALNSAKNLAFLLGVNEWINAVYKGKIANKTEGRPALHSVLRLSKLDPLSDQITKEVKEQRNRLLSVTNNIRSGELRATNGKPYSTILAIGIGGSDLGPKMAVKALSHFHSGPKIKFASNVDPSNFIEASKDLNPSSTLLVVSSKTFTTTETITNANLAFNWMSKTLGENAAKKQRLAITSSLENALAYGFAEDQILLFSSWVGGRTSIWSSVGLPIAIAIGSENFKSFLSGGELVDNHVLSDISNSIPFLMAILGFIQRTFMKSTSQAIIPYSYNLRLLPNYLQQLEMESNGKSVTNEGIYLNDPCVPVIWGASGTDAQHSFFQMLHQGVEKIPTDILLARSPSYNTNNPDIIESHKILAANALAQCEALSKGKVSRLPHKNFPGGRSVSLLTFNQISPRTLGAIIALYEYKVSIQAAMWRINPYDQFGVELGKELAEALISGNEKEAGMEIGSLKKLLKIIPEKDIKI